MSLTMPKEHKISANYVRIASAVAGHEQPTAISQEEFDQVVAGDQFTEDRFERLLPSLLPRTADELRFLKHLRSDTLRAPDQALLTAIAAAQAELKAVRRILGNVEVGLDHPDLLARAAGRLMHAAEQLRIAHASHSTPADKR
jgi:hypothetical protein